MNEFRHPLGNFKINTLKFIANFFSSITLFILGFFKKKKKVNCYILIFLCTLEG